MARDPRNAQASAGQAQKSAFRRAAAAGTHAPVRDLDWSNLRFFLELVRTGSHAAAAARLGVDRNTVARRVAALEAQLGLPLFERGPQGWRCTPAGEELGSLASRVEEDVLAVARHADVRDRSPSGTVRLTTSSHLASYLLVPAVPRLRERHPRVVLEVAADQRTFDLTRREADLAVRMGRPRDGGLVMRKLADVGYAFYGAAAAWPGPARALDLEREPLVAHDDSVGVTQHDRWLGEVAPRRAVAFRTNSTASMVSAARAGVGVAILPRYVGEAEPGLVRLDAPTPPTHEMWLLVHGDLRRTPRVAAVIEWVDEVVSRARGAITAA